MLIPIIKESKRQYVEDSQYWIIPKEIIDHIKKSHLASSQLALLEGLKMEWQAKITHEHGDTEEDYDIQEAKNYLIETFVESLEESITYLKTKI